MPALNSPSTGGGRGEADLDKLAAAMARRIYESKQATGKVDAAVVRHYADRLVEGLTTGYGLKLEEADFDTPDRLMLENLTKNAFHFSAAKNYQQIRALSQALLDDKGKLRSYREFKAVAEEINGMHSRHLKAEYDMAVASSQMAATWTRIQESKEALPLLQFDAVNDNRTSPICQSLHGVIRPVDDPFWDTYYPPNHWGCRSDVRQLASGKVTPMEQVVTPDKMPALFKTNLAKSGFLFPADHPYWIGLPEDVKQQAVLLMPYDLQFETIEKRGKARLRQHVLVSKQKDPDYVHVRMIAGEKVELGSNVDILPIISAEADPLLDIIFPDRIGTRTPDLRINGDLWEVKSPQAGFSMGTIRTAIASASGQARHVIINLPSPAAFNELQRVVNGKFKQHKNLLVVEFYYQGRFIRFERP